jgi:hypothetical protein
MGNICGAKPNDDQKKKNDEINTWLKTEKQRLQNEVKLLLLGIAASKKIDS